MQISFMVLVGTYAVCAGGADTVPLTETAGIEFATVEQGQASLRTRDAFVNSLSRFDKQARLKTDKQVSTDQYLDFVCSHVLAWKPDEKQKLIKVIENVRPRLRGLDLPFPETIRLVRTTGDEEGSAAYCRGSAIVLPTNVVRRSTEQLERLVTHELFHVLSSHNPALRQRLYAVVGFQPSGEVRIPPSLVDRKITNPDAPTMDYVVALGDGQGKQYAVPLLYASIENYDPAAGGSFFRYLEFRLMVVEEHENRLRPLVRDGDPVLLDPAKTPSYFDQIGRNTNYIIHPEEVLADNFVHLVNGNSDLSTPRIVKDMRNILAR